MTAPIRVLLADDHAMLRAGFRTILDLQPDIAVVGEAASGSEAVTLAGSLQPDVITMDADARHGRHRGDAADPRR